MMGWCPYDGEECRHDGYCIDCLYRKKEGEKGMTKEEIALNIACDLLIGSVLYGYDYDRIFNEIMEKDGCVTSNNIKEFILDHVEELGKEYFVVGGESE